MGGDLAGRFLVQGHRERGEVARARRLLEASVALLAGTETRKELDRARQDLGELLTGMTEGCYAEMHGEDIETEMERDDLCASLHPLCVFV